MIAALILALVTTHIRFNLPTQSADTLDVCVDTIKKPAMVKHVEVEWFDTSRNQWRVVQRWSIPRAGSRDGRAYDFVRVFQSGTRIRARCADSTRAGFGGGNWSCLTEKVVP